MRGAEDEGVACQGADGEGDRGGREESAEDGGGPGAGGEEEAGNGDGEGRGGGGWVRGEVEGWRGGRGRGRREVGGVVWLMEVDPAGEAGGEEVLAEEAGVAGDEDV